MLEYYSDLVALLVRVIEASSICRCILKDTWADHLHSIPKFFVFRYDPPH